MTNDPIALQMRNGLRRLAKAVVIITARHEGQRYAMAATAVSELSMDPPSMLICVNRSASMHPSLFAGAHFAINILRSDQTSIAKACSGSVKGEARFETGTWMETGMGVPRLADAQSSFICRNVERMDFGSHTIFIGQVEEVNVHGDVDALIYVDGRYTQVRAEDEN